MRERAKWPLPTSRWIMVSPKRTFYTSTCLTPYSSSFFFFSTFDYCSSCSSLRTLGLSRLGRVVSFSVLQRTRSLKDIDLQHDFARVATARASERCIENLLYGTVDTCGEAGPTSGQESTASYNLPESMGETVASLSLSLVSSGSRLI